MHGDGKKPQRVEPVVRFKKRRKKPMSCQRDCIILAGVGGIIPTVSRLASTYVTDPSTPMPEPGLYFGLLLFFMIGAVLAFAFSETNIRQAFILGVCAPGIITNIVAGFNDANSSKKTTLNVAPFISSAYAQDNMPASHDLLQTNSTSESVSTDIPKKIVINTNLSGAGAWDIRNINIAITAIRKDGTKENIAIFPAYQKSLEFKVPDSTTTVQIRAGEFVSQISLPDVEFTNATINSHVRVEGKHDFLWALGANRMPKIVSVNSSIGDVVIARPPISVKELLGEEVKGKDGTPVGKLEDIEIGPTGTIDKLLIKEGEGQIKSVLPQNVDRLNQELILNE